MTYVSWAAMYEGPSDAAYFGVLLPRVMDELIMARGIRNSTIPSSPAILLKRGDVMQVAAEACAAQHAFHLVFIHADTGGRALADGIQQRSTAYCEAMHAVCGLSAARCITVAPRHETEAWLLCDPSAITSALGFRGNAADVGLPNGASEAERLADPKSVLNKAVQEIRGRRRNNNPSTLYPAIAQRQNIDKLRESASFSAFEESLIVGLRDVGCL